MAYIIRMSARDDRVDIILWTRRDIITPQSEKKNRGG